MAEGEGGEGGGGGGRKRPLNPTPSGLKKKHKKLSPIALRALAALESDSSDSEDERDAKVSRRQEINTAPSASSAAAASSARLGRDTPAVEDIIELDGDSSVDGDANSSAKPRSSIHAAEAPKPASGIGDEQKKSSPSHQEQKRGPGRRRRSPQSTAVTSRQPTALADDGGVRPHAPMSEYGDILTSILSTAFDDKAMLARHRLKEGIKLGRRSPSSKSFQDWVASQNDRVPIIPQRQYIKNMNARQNATTNQEDTAGGDESSRAASPLSSAAISVAISAFLIQEGRKLIDSPVPVNNGAHATSKERRAPAIGHPQMQHQQTQHASGGDLSYQAAQQAYPGYYGYPQQQNPYLPQWNQHMNGWRHAQPYAAAPNSYNNVPYFPAVDQAMQPPPPVVHISPAKQSTAPAQKQPTASHQPHQQPQPRPQPTLKTATASAEIKLTSSNRPVIAKLPLAFGYLASWPADGGSKTQALSATAEWNAQGKLALESETITPRKRKPDSGQKTGSTPAPSGSSSTPKTPKTPAVLLSTEPAPNLPEGWTLKTFQRKSGKTAGETDKYFFSPLKGIKFRSKKGINTFLQILNEPGIYGDELEAKKLYKERGHKF